MNEEEFYKKIIEQSYRQWDDKKDIIKLSDEAYNLLHDFFLKKIKIETTDKDLTERKLSHIVLNGHVYAIELSDVLTDRYEPIWRDYQKGEKINVKNLGHHKTGIIKERLPFILQVLLDDYDYKDEHSAFSYHNLNRMKVFPFNHNYKK